MVRCVFFLIGLLVTSSAALAEQPNQFRAKDSPDDRACRGDAHRFCRDAIPDQFKVLSCLQEHRARLSRTCATMLQSHGV